MRRIWFTILLAVSLAISATASAWAAQACPYKTAPVTSHDCCPQPPAAPDDTPHHSKQMDCKLGQACRLAPAVAPELPVIAAVAKPVSEQPLMRQHDGVRSPVLTVLWRPPKSV
jgi:hypothetical protein